jgi:hypothetical protein
MLPKGMVGLLLLLLACPVRAASLQFGDMDVEGLAWETGGIDTSSPGDSLEMVGLVTTIAPFWGVDLGTDELTLRLTDLMVESETTQGGSRYVLYSKGRIELWLDPSRDHDYGVDPPNPTSPATFTNGTLFLAGELSGFTIGYYTGSPIGSLYGMLKFTEGSAIDLATQWMEYFGWPVLSGSVHPVDTGGPQGYDLSFTAYLYSVLDAVQRSSWGTLKHLYRAR